MKNGFYLSTFLAFDTLAYKLGVKLRHDQNVSLWKKQGNNISLVKYWELERITGNKQHSTTFKNKETVLSLLSFLLKEENLTLKDINEIWGTLGLERELQFFHPVDLSFHSIAHLFSSFFVEGSDVFYNNNVIALAADCGPDNLWEEDAFERNFYSGAVCIKGNIEFFSINSPGFLWAHARKRLGMREGTLMALATASTSKFLSTKHPSFLRRKITNRDAWPDMVDYIDNLIAQANKLSAKDVGVTFSGFDPAFSRQDNIASIVMKEIQFVSNEIMRQNIKKIISKFKLAPKKTILSLSGGFCLNCPTNSFLMEHFGFKKLLAPPCINDAGISLGQGFYYFYNALGRKMKSVPLSPYLGQDFPEIGHSIKKHKKFVSAISRFDEQTFVKDVEEYPVVWLNGRSEIGPRALGNRSLLSDPRTIEMKNSLNSIKSREWWRPVAPVVMQDKMDLYFSGTKMSPFMLELIGVKEEMRQRIPAVCHLDTTARVQTLTQNDNPLLYVALRGFFKETGVPLLCNTSLNDHNEPIINTPDEAFNFALRKKIKVIYLNGTRVLLKNHAKFKEDAPLVRVSEFSLPPDKNLTSQENPHNLTQDEVTVYWDYKFQLGSDALNDVRKIKKVRKMKKDIIKRYGYLAR